MSDQNLESLLDTIREKRGYLLPHHGLMAATAPRLLDAYDSMYTALALTEQRLGRHAHEYVWLAILIAKEEALGTHHIKRFRDAGGSDDDLASVLAVTSLAMGCPAYQFVDAHWLPHLAAFDARNRYRDAFRSAANNSPIEIAHLAAVAVHTCRSNWQALEWQIEAAYDDGVDEYGLAEALSLTMFPGGVPNYAKAAGVWRRLIESGRVTASDAFTTWARLAGQGGYDEASGVAAGTG